MKRFVLNLLEKSAHESIKETTQAEVAAAENDDDDGFQLMFNSVNNTSIVDRRKTIEFKAKLQEANTDKDDNFKLWLMSGWNLGI